MTREQSLVTIHWSLVRFHESIRRRGSALVLRGPRLHLVLDRLLGRGDQLGRPALGLDLLLGRLGEVVGLDDQLFGHVPGSENTDAVERLFRQPLGAEGLDVNLLAGGVEGVDIADVDHVELPGEHAVREPPLGEAAEQRGLATDERDAREACPGARELALVPEPGGLAVPGPDASADPALGLAFLAAGVNVGQVHYSSTPRSRAVSSRVRSCIRPSSVALTRLIGFVLPCVLVRMFLMPQAARTSRTPGPAFTPVPGPAGTMITRLPPNRPTTRCGMVTPRRLTRFCRLTFASPSLRAFSTAGGTSLALP